MIDILIPTMDNPGYLEHCINSIRANTVHAEYRLLVINNGTPGGLDWLHALDARVIEADGNKGWSGGLALGLRHSDAPACLFLNDDIVIPPSSAHWLADMAIRLGTSRTAAVGPVTNCAIGVQNMLYQTVDMLPAVSYLVGFCMLVLRPALDAVGGVDTQLYGGDDIDLSIRLRKAGHDLRVDRGIFVYHQGFVTGSRIYGPGNLTGGWNSSEYGRRVMDDLSAKHGAMLVRETFAQPERPLELVKARP